MNKRGRAQQVMISSSHNKLPSILHSSCRSTSTIGADEIQVHLISAENTNTAANAECQESVCHISCRMDPFLSLLDELEKGF